MATDRHNYRVKETFERKNGTRYTVEKDVNSNSLVEAKNEVMKRERDRGSKHISGTSGKKNR